MHFQAYKASFKRIKNRRNVFCCQKQRVSRLPGNTEVWVLDFYFQTYMAEMKYLKYQKLNNVFTKNNKFLSEKMHDSIFHSFRVYFVFIKKLFCFCYFMKNNCFQENFNFLKAHLNLSKSRKTNELTLFNFSKLNFLQK